MRERSSSCTHILQGGGYKKLNALGKLGLAAACAASCTITAGIFAATLGVADAHADTVKVNVSPACGFRTIGNATADSLTFTGNGFPGQEVNLNDNGTHYFNVYCNNYSGYKVLGSATHLMNDKDGVSAISFTDSYKSTGNDGLWTAVVTGGDSGAKLAGPGSAAAAIKSTTAPTADENGDAFSVAYKVYVGKNTTSGTYTGTTTYTLSPNPIPGLSNDMVMQSIIPEICSNTPYFDDTDPVATTFSLKDSRTGRQYDVRRLEDGNCYMVDELYLDPGTTYVNGSALGRTFTTPENSTDLSDWSSDNHNPVMYSSSSEAYFNYMAATAGTGSYEGGAMVESNPGNRYLAADSICPKGWQLINSSALYNLLDLEKYASGSGDYEISGAFQAYSKGHGNMCTAEGCPVDTFMMDSVAELEYAWAISWLSDSDSVLIGYGVRPGTNYTSRNFGLPVRCMFLGQ